MMRNAGQQLSAAGQGEWIKVDGYPYTRNQQWKARHPRRFRTVDDLAGFCVDLHEVFPVVTLRARNGATYSDNYATAAREISRRPAEDRACLIVEGEREPGAPMTFLGSVLISLNSSRGDVVTSIEIEGESQISFTQVTQLLDKYTERAPRRDIRRGYPSIEPVTIDTATQHERDRKVAHSAAKIGGWIGFAGGLLGGAVSGWLAAVLTSTGS